MRVSGGRVAYLDLNSSHYSPSPDLVGTLPPEIALLTGLEHLDLLHNPGLTGCIPASLQGIEYKGDLPFCGGGTSKKAPSHPGGSLLG